MIPNLNHINIMYIKKESINRKCLHKHIKSLANAIYFRIFAQKTNKLSEHHV